MHVTSLLLEAGEVLGRIVDEQILVDDMVAGQQHADGCGERQPAVAAVGRETFVAHVGRNTSRQIVCIGERMQAQPFVADAHLVGTECYVLQARGIGLREREILFEQAGTIRRTDDFGIRQPLQPDEPALADDSFELIATLQKLLYGILILHLLRNDEAARKGVERTVVRLCSFVVFVMNR